MIVESSSTDPVHAKHNGQQAKLQVLLHFRSGFLRTCQHPFGVNPHARRESRTHPLLFIFPSTDLIHHRHSVGEDGFRLNICVLRAGVTTERSARIPLMHILSSRRLFHFIFLNSPLTPIVSAGDFGRHSNDLGPFPLTPPGVCPQTSPWDAQGFSFQRNREGQTKKRNQSSLRGGTTLAPVYQLLFQSDKRTETHRRNNSAASSGDPCFILTYQKGRRR